MQTQLQLQLSGLKFTFILPLVPHFKEIKSILQNLLCPLWWKFPVLFPLTSKPRAKCPHRFLPSLAKKTKRWKVDNFKTEEQTFDSHNFLMVKEGHILKKNGNKMNKKDKETDTKEIIQNI